GRGSFGNPWLFRDSRALLDGYDLPAPANPAERFAVALEHDNMAIELQGDSRRTVLEFRKHFGWYTRGMPGATALRQRLFQVETMCQAGEIFAEYLSRDLVASAA